MARCQVTVAEMRSTPVEVFFTVRKKAQKHACMAHPCPHTTSLTGSCRTALVGKTPRLLHASKPCLLPRGGDEVDVTVTSMPIPGTGFAAESGHAPMMFDSPG